MAFSMMFRIILLIVVVISFTSPANTLHTVVLSPINAGKEAALITIPGASIAGEAYKPLGVAIQKATPLTLWVALASGFPSSGLTFDDVKKAIDLAIEDLHAAGMSVGVPVFVAGHSQGGMDYHLRVSHNAPCWRQYGYFS